jgi:hypothetical protein
MTIINKEKCLTAEGVAFSVTVDCKHYACVVSREALSDLIKMGRGLIKPFDAYTAYKSRIHGIARRLVSAGIIGSPVVLRLGHFE